MRRLRLLMPAVTVVLFFLATGAVDAHQAHRMSRPDAGETEIVSLMRPSVESTGSPSINPTVDNTDTATPEGQSAQHQHLASDRAVGGFFVRLGRLHPAIVHFPIALILMVALAEFMNFLRPSSLYDQAARFMLLMAALTAPPTAALGWLFAQGETYVDPEAFYLWWHQFLGICVVPLVLLAFFLRWSCGTSTTGRRAYVIDLVLLTIIVAVTGHFGGTLTHGVGHFNVL